MVIKREWHEVEPGVVKRKYREPAEHVLMLFDTEAKCLPFLVRCELGGWKWWHAFPAGPLPGHGRDWNSVTYTCGPLKLVRTADSL